MSEWAGEGRKQVGQLGQRMGRRKRPNQKRDKNFVSLLFGIDIDTNIDTDIDYLFYIV